MTKGWKNLTFYAKTHIFLCSDECFPGKKNIGMWGKCSIKFYLPLYSV